MRILRRAGLLDPRFVVAYTRAAMRHGQSMAMGIAAAARLRPNHVAIVDDAGELDFAQLENRVFSIAEGLRQVGVGPGHNVGMLCRNHRGFILGPAPRVFQPQTKKKKKTRTERRNISQG
ncbi:MAG: AMP-binding protein, partial [Myxococcota bacterium]